MFKAGWYNFIYHDISWEENPYMRGIGGSCPPDLFREHVRTLSQYGDLVSVQDGFAAWRSNSLDRPTFSFWFDDGFVGVRKYALPVLQEHGVAAATAVCSRFVSRTELFWRCKLSFLSAHDGLRELRPRLAKFGYSPDVSLKSFTLDNFHLQVIEQIDEVYRRYTTDQQMADAFRLFDTCEGIRQLQQHGWLVGNHSAAHYPVTEITGLPLFAAQYREAETYLSEHLGTKGEFWVAPFGRMNCCAPNLLAEFLACKSGGQLVLVDNQVNHPRAAEHTVIKRIFMPVKPAAQIVKMLKRVPYGN